MNYKPSITTTFISGYCTLHVSVLYKVIISQLKIVKERLFKYNPLQKLKLSDISQYYY